LHNVAPNEPYRRLHRLSHEQRSFIIGLQINCDSPHVVAADTAGRPVMQTLGRLVPDSPRFALRRDGSVTVPIEPVVALTDEDVHDEDAELLIPILQMEGE
jgi:hypothetical protein